MNRQTIFSTYCKLQLLYYTQLIVQPAPKASYNMKCWQWKTLMNSTTLTIWHLLQTWKHIIDIYDAQLHYHSIQLYQCMCKPHQAGYCYINTHQFSCFRNFYSVGPVGLCNSWQCQEISTLLINKFAVYVMEFLFTYTT